MEADKDSRWEVDGSKLISISIKIVALIDGLSTIELGFVLAQLLLAKYGERSMEFVDMLSELTPQVDSQNKSKLGSREENV